MKFLLKCSKRGVFMAGLPHKVKLAINTKTYTDDNGEDFTVSMSVYDKEDFTGLGTFPRIIDYRRILGKNQKRGTVMESVSQKKNPMRSIASFVC